MKYQEIKKDIETIGFKVVSHDFERPQGGFLVIDESQAQAFANQFFKGLDVNTLRIGGKLSPKILIVKPMHTYLGNIITDVQKFGKYTKELQELLEVILMKKMR